MKKVYENIGFSQIPAWLIKMFRKRFENENVHSDEDKRQVMHHIFRQRYFMCLHLQSPLNFLTVHSYDLFVIHISLSSNNLELRNII